MIKVLEAMGDLERLGVRELILDLGSPVSPAETAMPSQLGAEKLGFRATVGQRYNERVQQQSTAACPLLSAVQRGSPAFSAPQRH
jgi:hypothetical protein